MQLELFDSEGVSPVAEPPRNPMIRVYGAGPAGAKCRDCAYLIVKRWDRKYFKCPFRGDTNGPGTDHRVGWPACAKYRPASGGERE